MTHSTDFYFVFIRETYEQPEAEINKHVSIQIHTVNQVM